ncbi:DNRLRE domain-containing protein [Streptomyces sp. CC208A]|uniref:DNRLRE domain-containing protein n=1 Tax=Streptomyces sp. CC208A TaxID=3044573 RepID=UPI0024A880B5|nr:DNRLRE domain-containing protein [Streptomyces sp. CC208A]
MGLPNPSRGRARARRLTAVAGVLAAALVAETALIVGTSGEAVAVSLSTMAVEQPVREPVKAPAATEAADLPSAQVAAKLSGKRVEALSERTETTSTWANPNGTVTLEAASGPQRYRDALGTWRDIDVDLVKLPDGSVGAQAHPLGLKLAGRTPAATVSKIEASGGRAGEKKTPAVPLVSLDDGHGKRISVHWRGALAEPTLKGTEARYADALPFTDLIVESTRTGYEQFLELKDKRAVAANGSVTLTLDAKGVTARKNADDSVSFLDDKTGRVVGTIPAPVMWDAQVDPNSGEHTHTAPVGLALTQNGNSVDITLTPDAAFLADPKTRFPVTIDPAVSIGASFDTFVQQGYGTDQSAATELKLGNNGSGQVARSFLHFPMAKITGKVIESAKLNLWNFHSWSCTAKSWEVWDTGNASTSTRWTAQPTWFNKWTTSTSTKGYSSSCADGWVSADVKTLVQGWANNGKSTNSLGIRATDESDPYGWKRFNSGNAASSTPYLSVTYNTKPGAAVPVSPLSGASTNDTTPTITGKATDADGNTVQLTYEIWTSNGTAALLTGKSAFVASGTNAPWTPTTALAPGAYKWRAAVYDGSAWNGSWSAWQNFTVDTTAPAATKITSTDFPAETWSGTPDASGDISGAFTLTPPTSDVKDVQYALDGGAWTTLATTGSPVTANVKVTSGRHTLTARTRDAAGNVSAVATHVFYAGSGAALIAPAEGDRPARRTALTAQGKDTYTGVTYQYRRGETDTWKNVPLAHVTKAADGSAVTAWPLAAPAGKPAALNWDITATLAEDGPVDVRALFTDGTTSAGSPANTVAVDRNAGTAPTENVGPGEVNLLTGDFVLSETDTSLFDLTVTRTASSRRPSTGASQEGQAAIFGKEWTAGTAAEESDSDWAYLKQTSATSVAVVDAEGEELGFTATTGGGWKPEPGAEDLSLTGALSGSLTLKDTEGAVTVFSKPDAAATAWQVATTGMDGLANSTTTVVSETVTVDGKKLARPKLVVAPTSAVSATTCAATPSTKGCRALEYVYATTTTATGYSTGADFGDFAGQVKEIRAWSTEPGAATATSKGVAVYRYDAAGRLRQQWNPNQGQATQIQYSYDSAGRIFWIQAQGELPWNFDYGKAGANPTSGEGMLLKVRRPALVQGSADQTSGEAATSIVYDVPLTGASAPYQMGVQDVAAWGQTDVPTDATAVFPADSVPAAHAGSGLAGTAYRRATVTYTDVSGRQVNTAVPGGHISTTEFDEHGNTVRELSPGNRAVALGLSANDRAVQAELGIAQLASAERADLLATRSVYNESGTRELQELGPLHRATLTEDLVSGGTAVLKAGDTASVRSWTVNEYDAGRPTDGTAKVEDKVTKVTIGGQVPQYPSVHVGAQVTQTVYDWVKGLPVKVIRDPSGLALTTSMEYDAQGRVTKEMLPGATGTDAGTRVTTYWSATGTGTCQGRPEWADKVCSTGPGGAITGGGTNPSQLPTVTTEYSWWGSEAKVTTAANGVTRTVTTTYDGAGRPSRTVTSGGVGTAVPEVTTEYNGETGREVKTSSTTGGTIYKAYDKLGRLISYVDADGGETKTEYDLLDRPVKVTDSVPSTVTYTYDHAVEPRGLPTRTTDSVAGAFEARYDADGSVTSEKLPGGYTLTVTEDTTGAATSRVYTRDSDGLVVVTDSVDESVHGQVVNHSGWSTQSFSYDKAGRLTTALDTVGDACTRRSYAFDKRTNRTGLTTAEGAAGAACPTTGGTTTTHTYDSADRLVDSGYVYDALGRTTALPGTSLAYYANDLVRQQTAGNLRQTWSLDADHRFRGWTVESLADGVWTQTESKTNHYDGEGDNPRWITEDTAKGIITRNVDSASGDLTATTGSTGNVVLQLTNIHGDVALQLPLDPAEAPQVLDSDEYGNARTGQPVTRYGWLGGKQRSSETLTGLTLMGVRVYNPATGRFLSLDPVYGGSANAYDYVNADPVNAYDLDGKWGCGWCKKGWNKFKKSRIGKHIRRHRKIYGWAAGIGIGVVGAACVAATAGICAGAGGLIIGAAFGAAGGAAKYRIGNARRSRSGYYKRMALGAAGVLGRGVYARWRLRGAPQSPKRWLDNFRREKSWGKHRRKVHVSWGFGTRWIR